MQKFFNFINNAEAEEAELYINGEIVNNDDSEFYEAFGIECTAPKGFKEQLTACNGKPISVYIDSYGGDVLSASAIYTMLREYKGQVTVKIDSIAASAASVIAMAGDKVLMSPTAFLMIHDPSTIVWGNITEVKQELDALRAVKEGIINAYERKCNGKASREKISKLMTDETWLDYNAALEYGFIDGEIGAEKSIVPQEILNTIKNQRMQIFNKISKKDIPQPQAKTEETEAQPVEDNGEEELKQKNLNRYKALLLNKRRK